MTGLCKNCKHWGDASYEEPTHHYCLKSEKEGDSGFGTQDGEPFNSGRFASGPEFGCVHFEEKV